MKSYTDARLDHKVKNMLEELIADEPVDCGETGVLEGRSVPIRFVKICAVFNLMNPGRSVLGKCVWGSCIQGYTVQV